MKEKKEILIIEKEITSEIKRNTIQTFNNNKYVFFKSKS